MIHKLFTFPFRALMLIGENVREEADKELYNIPYLQQQLMQLHMMYEMQEIGEEDYLNKEQELLDRYKIAKEREQENQSD